MKSQRKILSLVLTIVMLIGCLPNIFVFATDIDVSDYTYVVDNMKFFDGETKVKSLSYADTINVNVTRRIDGVSTDTLIVAAYTDTGEYLGMSPLTHYVDYGKTSTVKVPLDFCGEKTVGEIRAFVWNSLSEMTPLSNVLSSNNNMIIDPKLELEETSDTEFNDVSTTHSFANAVSLMSSLGIIRGYEDGTFRPDDTIRVTDAARFITYFTKGQVSASILADETLVADEIMSSVERGYINYCVDAKYLIPDENGYVNAHKNITVGEFLKLTVNALGYRDFAQASGGWPRGYLSIAERYGIADVESLSFNSDTTRATAAEILYSAINAPVVMIVGMSYTENGILVPNFQIQDGESSVYYKSILTEKFGIYTVDGYVTENSRDNMGLKSDEVKFGIASSKKYSVKDLNFSDSIYDYITLANSYERILHNVKVGETDAAKYKGIYATAFLKITKDNDWNIVKFIPSDKNVTVSFDKADLDTYDYEDAYGNLVQSQWQMNTSYLKFFEDGSSTSKKYTLSDNVTVYVNDVKVNNSDPVWEYVIAGNAHQITLVDTYKTDGKYDVIRVTSHITAMVEIVSNSNKIIFANDDIGANFLNLADDDYTPDYKIYYDGEEIDAQDLQKGDILSIRYDVTAGADKISAFRNSNFYEIYVSRDIMSGTYSSRDADEYTIKVNSVKYHFTDKAKYTQFTSSVKLGNLYIFNLDAFGKIYSWQFDYSSLKWGILERFTLSSSDDDYTLAIYTDDGDFEQYYFDAKKAKVIMPDGGYMTMSSMGSEAALNEAVKALVYEAGTIKTNIVNRVIQYKVSATSHKITELKFIGYSSGSDSPYKFDDRTYTIGSVKLSDSTKIIDACYYYKDELSTTKASALYDGAKYRAYGYGDKVNGAYLFTLLTSTTISPMNYAIVEGFTEGDTLQNCYINLYNPKENDYLQIPFTENSKITTPRGGSFYADEYYILDDFWDEVTSIIYDNNSNLTDITQRVVSYRILHDDACGTIEDIKFLDYTSLVTKLTAFDSESNTIGKISLSEDALIVDASDTENNGICVFTPESFENGRKCNAYAYNKNSRGAYPFILITEASLSDITSYKWGIAEKFTISSSDEEYKLTLAGTSDFQKAYYFDASVADVVLHDGTIINESTESSKKGLNIAVKNLIYSQDSTKYAVENRVVRYKLNPTTKKIARLEFMPTKEDTLYGNNGREEYSQNSHTIGDISLNDTTKIVDARDYASNEKLSPASLDDLYDGTSYEAYAYGNINDSAYPFVLISESNLSDKAYAIAETFTTANSIDLCTVSLHDIKKSNKKTLFFDLEKSKITYPDKTTKYTSNYSSATDFCQELNSLINTDISVTNRVVSYRINNDTNNIEELTFLPFADSVENGTFSRFSDTIGDINLTSDALILDTSKTPYTTYNLSSFPDGTECEAYAYDLTYFKEAPFILVTSSDSSQAVILPTKWGIAEKFTKSSLNDDYKFAIFTSDGSRKSYFFDSSKANVTLPDGRIINKITEGSEDALNSAVKNLVYFDGLTRNNIENLVILYHVSASSGMVDELKFVAPSITTLSGINGKEQFDAKNNTLGLIRLGENTTMIDATLYYTDEDLFEITPDYLTHETYYKAYAYGERVNGVYPFVLVTEGKAPYNSNTRFAVVTQDGYAEETDENGDIVYSISAMYCDATELLLSDDVPTTQLSTLKRGDVLYFETNSKGYITNFDKIFSFVGSGVPKQSDLAQYSLVNDSTNYANLAANINIPMTFGDNFSPEFTTAWTGIDTNAVQLIYGPVLDRTNDDVTFGVVNSDGKTNTMNPDEAVIFDLASELNVYTYDYSMSKDLRFDYSPSPSAIAKSMIPMANYESDECTIDWNKTVDGSLVNQECVSFAFAVVVEGEVVDIFEFVAK